jgi:hypothetical protein
MAGQPQPLWLNDSLLPACISTGLLAMDTSVGESVADLEPTISTNCRTEVRAIDIVTMSLITLTCSDIRNLLHRNRFTPWAMSFYCIHDLPRQPRNSYIRFPTSRSHGIALDTNSIPGLILNSFPSISSSFILADFRLISLLFLMKVFTNCPRKDSFVVCTCLAYSTSTDDATDLDLAPQENTSGPLPVRHLRDCVRLSFDDK